MVMQLEVLPARKGDCMFVHFVKDDGSLGLILIDGGPSGVWGDSLKPRLEALRTERAPDGKLLIDVVVISHVDDDHINGILRLLKDIDDEGFPVVIGEIWHNSFDRVIGNDETVRMNLSSPVLASVGGEAGALEIDDDSEDGGELRDTAKVLASVKQGDELQSLARKLNIPINLAFDNSLIIKENAPQISLGELTISIVGPLQSDLQSLQNLFDKWLTKKLITKDTTSLLAALSDNSAANLSSLVLLIEDSERSLLLTGDGRTDKILLGLGDGNHEFDILKMPHHGSDRNVDDHFFNVVKAKTYVFSGDGEHGNPERKTVEMLVGGSEIVPDLVFTYPLDELDIERKHDYQKWRKKRLRKGKIEPEWDANTQALETFLTGDNSNVQVIQPNEVSVVL